MCLRPPIIELDVLAFDKARRAQALAESAQTDRIRIRADGREKPDYRHPRLLCPRRKRPRGRAAEQCDELAPPHSITSSAMSCICVGTFSPSAFAVFMLIASSNFVGACTGRLAGLSPLRMRSTYEAARRNKSRVSGP